MSNDEKLDNIARKIRAGMAMKKWKKADLAIQSNMSLSQIIRRLQFPGVIKLEELVVFEDVLDIKLLD